MDPRPPLRQSPPPSSPPRPHFAPSYSPPARFHLARSAKRAGTMPPSFSTCFSFLFALYGGAIVFSCVVSARFSNCAISMRRYVALLYFNVGHESYSARCYPCGQLSFFIYFIRRIYNYKCEGYTWNYIFQNFLAHWISFLSIFFITLRVSQEINQCVLF